MARFTRDERDAMLTYCESDVQATTALLDRMRPHLDLTRALFRASSMVAFAQIEATGIPIDVRRLRSVQARWTDIEYALVTELDRNFQVFEGLTFKIDRFDHYLATHGIPWPRLDSGQLDLKDDTFKARCKAYPHLDPLRELCATLSKLRLQTLAVGPDGRNRTFLSPFGQKTSRCNPKAGYIFGPATWFRSFIRPAPGWASPTWTGTARSWGSARRSPRIRR